MRALMKLFKHGSTTGVVIPRQMLVKKGWLCGERVIVEELEADAFLLRRPTQDDVDTLIRPTILSGPAASIPR